MAENVRPTPIYYDPTQLSRDRSVTARTEKRRRAKALETVAGLIKGWLDVDPAPLFRWAQEHIEGWLEAPSDAPLQLALQHIHTHGCGGRALRSKPCAAARAIVILGAGMLSVGTVPIERTTSQTAAAVSRDLLRLYEERLLEVHPSQLKPQQLRVLEKLAKNVPVAEEISAVGADMKRLHDGVLKLHALAVSIQKKWERRALSPEMLRRNNNERPSLALAEAALRAGGFDDAHIGVLLRDTRPGQRSSAAARVGARVRARNEIPRVVASKKIRARIFEID
jgi:hypothetical protein